MYPNCFSAPPVDKEFIQNKITQHPNITLNDFENELFKKIGELYDEMQDKPDMIGCGTDEGDYQKI